ncbi:hypothetical protein [Noviherbaspirillum malthae]|uniref:hypothetical protein n=1 Tax=Noviherbaspirillum malthae TaxID=1260987 RepID=UPI00188FBC46|nr:hypothetical protein [Noviherbaspirillum malthae]
MNSATSNADMDELYDQVPADFPRPGILSSLAGAHPKLALVQYNGKFYSPGCTPPEVWARWDICEDLAKHLADRCRETEKGKYAHLSRAEILSQYYERSLRTGWGSDEEMRWISHRTAQLVGWPALDI